MKKMVTIIKADREVIISVKPKYAELILNGHKQVELRKVLWANTITERPSKIWVYSSGTSVHKYANISKKLIGVIVDYTLDYQTPDELWRRYEYQTGITKVEFNSYYAKKTAGYAIFINKFSRLSPIESPLKKWPGFHSPQNFCYVTPELLIDPTTVLPPKEEEPISKGEENDPTN